jgi:hypothetical protein
MRHASVSGDGEGIEAPMTTMAETRGETVFEKYLNTLGVRFTYEPPIGNRRPDYLVHAAAGGLLCEIKRLRAQRRGPSRA